MLCMLDSCFALLSEKQRVGAKKLSASTLDKESNNGWDAFCSVMPQWL